MTIKSATMGKMKPSPYSLRLRNRAMFAYASDFYSAAIKTRRGVVRIFLLAHALELYFKAFLLHSGTSLEQIKRKYGHNLSKLLQESRAKGLDSYLHFSSQTVTAIEELSMLHVAGRLRYFSLLEIFSPSKLPDIPRLFKFAKSLHKVIEKELRRS